MGETGLCPACLGQGGGDYYDDIQQRIIERACSYCDDHGLIPSRLKLSRKRFDSDAALHAAIDAMKKDTQTQ